MSVLCNICGQLSCDLIVNLFLSREKVHFLFFFFLVSLSFILGYCSGVFTTWGHEEIPILPCKYLQKEICVSTKLHLTNESNPGISAL